LESLPSVSADVFQPAEVLPLVGPEGPELAKAAPGRKAKHKAGWAAVGGQFTTSGSSLGG